MAVQNGLILGVGSLDELKKQSGRVVHFTGDPIPQQLVLPAKKPQVQD